jgi:hypothetical protein
LGSPLHDHRSVTVRAIFPPQAALLTPQMASFGVQVTHVKDVASPHNGTTECQPQMNDRRTGNEE